jgi:hypothetical protein
MEVEKKYGGSVLEGMNGIHQYVKERLEVMVAHIVRDIGCYQDLRFRN